jgi:hypothetical protein
MQYTITVSPAIPQGAGAYTGDEIAVWIDYNNDFTFSSVERVGYVLVATGWSNQLTFTVPTTAITGSVRMRVRISYSVVAESGAPIDPCAVATYGETEDYTVNIAQGGNVGISELNADQILVYPNPTSSELNIDLGNIDYNFSEIQLVDLTGRVVTKISVNEQDKLYNVSTSSLSNGIYNVKIVGKDGSLTKRIIKQ